MRNRYESLAAINDLPPSLRNTINEIGKRDFGNIYKLIHDRLGLDIENISADEIHLSHRLSKKNLADLGKLAFIRAIAPRRSSYIDGDNEIFVVVINGRSYLFKRHGSDFYFEHDDSSKSIEYKNRWYSGNDGILKVVNDPDAEVEIYTVDVDKVGTTEGIQEQRKLSRQGMPKRKGLDYMDYRETQGFDFDKSGYRIGDNLRRYIKELEKLRQERGEDDNDVDRIIKSFKDKLYNISMEDDLVAASAQLEAFGTIYKDMSKLIRRIGYNKKELDDIENDPEAENDKNTQGYKKYLEKEIFKDKLDLKSLYRDFDKTVDWYRSHS